MRRRRTKATRVGNEDRVDRLKSSDGSVPKTRDRGPGSPVVAPLKILLSASCIPVWGLCQNYLESAISVVK